MVVNTNIINVKQLQNSILHVNIQSVELILSDDLYRAICFKTMGAPCKGLKNPHENKKLFGFPLKISIDKSRYFDFFSFRINNYEVYMTTVHVDTFPAFYTPLYLLEPIVFERWKEGSLTKEELQKNGYTFFDHQKFIQFTLKRIFQVIEMLNVRENYISPFWIKYQNNSKILI